MKSNNLAKWVLVIACTISTFSTPINARQKFATLPGGLLYPQFGIASFTNAAALMNDWYSEVQALYSPGKNDNSMPHSYLLGYSTANPKFGFNIGYLGSTQSGVAVHNLFGGLAYRKKKHAFGLALRKNDLVYSPSLPVDLSWMWDITHRLTLGVVGYDLLKYQTMAIGLGYEDYSYYSLEVDVQFPLPGYPELATREYSANFATVFYFMKAVGVSLGTRYQKWINTTEESSKWRTSLGGVVRIKKNWSIVGTYTSTPDSYTIGLIWGNPATAQQWIEYWLERDRRGLDL